MRNQLKQLKPGTKRTLHNEKENEVLEALVKKAMQGNTTALYALCEKCAKSVLFRTKYMLGNEMDAEDVAQNVLLRLCESIRKLRDPKTFRGWLGSIVVNETRRYILEHSKHSNIEQIDDYLEEIYEEDTDALPKEYMETKSHRDAVMEIVLGLPIRQREAVILHYYDELNITEVAVAMSITHQSASQYLSLAREKLKIAVENRPFSPGRRACSRRLSSAFPARERGIGMRSGA